MLDSSLQVCISLASQTVVFLSSLGQGKCTGAGETTLPIIILWFVVSCIVLQHIK